MCFSEVFKKNNLVFYIYFFVLICLFDFGNQFVTSDVTSLFSISAIQCKAAEGRLHGFTTTV